MPVTDDLISLITNVGFPVTLCFILIRYVLQTIGDKLDRLDASINHLVETIKSLQTVRGNKNETE